MKFIVNIVVAGALRKTPSTADCVFMGQKEDVQALIVKLENHSETNEQVVGSYRETEQQGFDYDNVETAYAELAEQLDLEID